MLRFQIISVLREVKRSMSKFMMNGWLKNKSISQRLGIQATASIVLSLSLAGVLTWGALKSMEMIDEDNHIAEQALSAALLEKDFASLERDAFRHALLRNSETDEAFRGNVGDLNQAIADARSIADPAQHAAIDEISASAATYAQAVDAVIASGPTDATGASKIMAAGDIVDAQIEAIRDPVIEKSHAISAMQVDQANKVMWITIAIALLVGLCSFVLARMIRSAISGELSGITSAIRRILNGDHDVVIDDAERKDDVGELARAAVQLRDTTIEKQQSDADMAEMATLVGDCLQKMSQGDMTTELTELSERYEGLRANFNSTIHQLHGTLVGVADAADTIRVGSSEISQASDDLASRTEKHAAELASTTETVNRITAMLEETAAGAANAHRDVSDAMSEAKVGSEIIGRAVNAMKDVEESTSQIEQIIAVIDSIAFQTNLLALNAGVEAARAGASGSGFAVVANEVRALAQRSADAAKDIKELIEKSSGQVTEGAGMVRKTGEAFTRIVEKISLATELVEDISSKAESQSVNLKEANRSMDNMDLVTQQNAAMVEESNAAARNLATEADRLAAMVQGFVLRREGASSPRRTSFASARTSAPARAAPPQLRAAASARAPDLNQDFATEGNLALADDDWSEF